MVKECLDEAFYQRSVPFATGLGFAAHYGVINGHLKGNRTYGSLPKVLIGTAIGVICGYYSYRSKCADKMLDIPNSQFAEIIRMNRYGDSYSDDFNAVKRASRKKANDIKSPAEQFYSNEFHKPSPLNLDTERPQLGGIDDYRLNMDSSHKFSGGATIEKPREQVTYEQLRQRNREEYARNLNDPYYRPLTSNRQTIIRAKSSQTETEAGYSASNRNKYGDWR